MFLLVTVSVLLMTSFPVKAIELHPNNTDFRHWDCQPDPCKVDEGMLQLCENGTQRLVEDPLEVPEQEYPVNLVWSPGQGGSSGQEFDVIVRFDSPVGERHVVQLRPHEDKVVLLEGLPAAEATFDFNPDQSYFVQVGHGGFNKIRVWVQDGDDQVPGVPLLAVDLPEGQRTVTQVALQAHDDGSCHALEQTFTGGHWFAWTWDCSAACEVDRDDGLELCAAPGAVTATFTDAALEGTHHMVWNPHAANGAFARFEVMFRADQPQGERQVVFFDLLRGIVGLSEGFILATGHTYAFEDQDHAISIQRSDNPILSEITVRIDQVEVASGSYAPENVATRFAMHAWATAGAPCQTVAEWGQFDF